MSQAEYTWQQAVAIASRIAGRQLEHAADCDECGDLWSDDCAEMQALDRKRRTWKRRAARLAEASGVHLTI